MDINQIILYSVVMLATNPLYAGYTDKGAVDIFKQCLHAKTHVDRVKCETEYLQYRARLDDARSKKK
jgi:hypothetical protein